MDAFMFCSAHDLRGRNLYLKISLAAFITVGLSLAVLAVAHSEAAAQNDQDELLVGFKQSATETERSATVGSAGGRITERFDEIDTVVVRTGRGIDRTNLERNLEDLNDVSFVEPNYRAELLQVPNDPSFGDLWGLNNTGQLGGAADVDIDATDAWDRLTSTGSLIVSIIDTGIDDNHPDLTGNIWTNTGEIPSNGEDDDGNGYIDDIYGYDFANNDGDPDDDHDHGTHVAGIVGAQGNNAVGISGVAWTTKLMGVKFMNAGGDGSVADAISSINYSVANGASVINASWKIVGFSQSLSNAIQNARDQGVLFVASAGNDASNNDVSPVYPASYDLDNIVSVASHTRYNTLSSFSNYGASSVDLAAPGSDILSTLPSSTYGSLSGTSMAAPYVTGAAALYLAANPGRQPSQIRGMLVQTADLGTAYAGITASGGRLNVNRLINEDINVPVPTPPATAPVVPPVTEDPEEEERFKLLKPKPNASFSIKARKKSRRVSFKWSRIEDVREFRLYLRGKRVKKGRCFRSQKSKRPKKKKNRTCYRLKKTLRDSDGTGPRLAKRTTSLRLKTGKYRYLVVAVTNDGKRTRGRYHSKNEEKVVASLSFKVIRSRASKRR